MAVIASFLKLIVAGIYSMDTLQAKQDWKSKALENFAQAQRTESKRDQESSPEQLLPFRSTFTEPKTHLQQIISKGAKLFKELSFGLVQQENGQHQLFNGGILQVMTILVTLKLVTNETNFSQEFLMQGLQVGAVLMLIYLQSSFLAEPKQLQRKLGLSALFLVASEYLQQQWPDKTDKGDNMIRFSLSELLIYECAVTLSISAECFYTSYQLRDDSDIRNQGAVNKLANSVFKDTTEDGTQAGYAVMHVDTTLSDSPEVCLLRYNPRLEKLLQCCGTTIPHIGTSSDSSHYSPQVRDRSSGTSARKKALTERLMNQFSSMQQSKDQKQSLLLVEKDKSQTLPITFKSIFLQKHSELMQDHVQESDKGEQLPLLFDKVFSCDNSKNMHGRGILKTKSHSEFKISVQVLCKESSLFFVKIENKSTEKLRRSQSSIIEKKSVKVTPVKKVSFNQFEKGSPQFSSRQLRKQKREEQRENRRKQSRSSEDLLTLLASGEKDKQKGKESEIQFLDLGNSLDDIPSVSSSSRTSEAESISVSTQSQAKTEDAQTQTNVSEEKQVLLPLSKLDCQANDKNDEGSETPSFNSSKKNVNNFQTACNEYQTIEKFDSFLVDNSQNNMAASLGDLINSMEGSNLSLVSSDSLESESIIELHAERRDNLIIRQHVLAARSATDESTIKRNMKNLLGKEGFHTEVFVDSAKRNHTNLAVVPTEELKFTHLLESKSPRLDQSLPWRSDEAGKDGLSSLQGKKDIFHLTDSSLFKESFLNKKKFKQSALSVSNGKFRQQSILFHSGNRSNNSFKHMSSETFPILLDSNRDRIKRRSGSLQSQTFSSKVYRTSIINEKQESQSHKPSDLQSMQSKQSKSSKQSKTSLQNAEAKIQANKLFVYKIIHDLRHPTDSVSQGLSQLVQELPQEKFVQDPNLRLNNENIYQYKAHDRVTKALKICIEAISASSSHSSKLQLSSPQCSRSLSHSLSGISKGFEPRRTQTERRNGRFVSPIVSRSKVNLVAVKDTMLNAKRRRLSEVNNEPHTPISKKLKKLYDDFNSIDIKKIELPKKVIQPCEEQKQLDPQRPQAPEEEEKQSDLMLSKDDSPISVVKYESESIEDEEALQIDDNISEGSSKVSSIYTAKLPQKKQFERDSVHDLVQKGLESPRNKQFERRPFSLAADRLIFKSAAMAQIRDSEIDVLKPKLRNRICLSEVLDVMDNFIQESTVKCQSKQDRHSGRINSMPKQWEGRKNLFSEKSEEAPFPKVCESENSPIIQQLEIKSQSRSINPLLFGQFDKEKGSDSNLNFSENVNAKQDFGIGSRLRRSIKILQIERKYLVQMVNDLLQKTITTRNRIETMGGQTEMMMMLLRDLMNQAQLGNNTFTMVNEYFNVCSLVKRCIQTLKTQASLKNVQLGGPILQKPSDSCYFHQLYSDERRYTQFILNFLSNSIKFTPSGGQVTVLLKIKQVSELSSHECKSKKSEKDQQSLNSPLSPKSVPDKEILPDSDENEDPSNQNPVQNSNRSVDYKMVHFEMIFRDSGVGISPENQQRLFQNFSKVTETQEVNKSGVGLGLSICKEIINAHGGSVDIESEMGKGTDFIINLKQKCIVDHNWQVNMKEIEAKGMLEIHDSHISPYMIKEQSEHSSEQASVYDSDQNDSDKEIGDKPNTRNSKNIVDDRMKVINSLKKHLQLDQHLSTIEEGSIVSYNESSIAKKMTRCLLANDDLFLLKAFEATLKTHFDLIETVENGQAAVNAVKAQPINFYSVIVLDIQMPIMNGVQACEQILAHFQQELEKSLDQGTFQSQVKSSLIQNQRKSSNISQLNSSSMSMSQKKSSNSRVSNKSFAFRMHPQVYALTSEAEPDQIEQFMKAGFKQVYNTLDQIMIRQVLKNAGLVYREKIMESNSEHSMFNSDDLQESVSSKSSQLESEKLNSDSRLDSPREEEKQNYIRFNAHSFMREEQKVSTVSDDQDQAPYQQ